jgi:putative ABC transport system substrate-binding protein
MHIRRRELIAFLGSAVAWPGTARGQQSERTRRIGFLHGLAENDPEARARIGAFRQGLAMLGWIEGRNITIDYRFAEGDPSRAKAIVAKMVGSAPDLIVGHSTPIIAALKQATTSIPVVFAVVNDPVGQGFIASLARPGRNITGFTFIDFPIIGKWLELLKGVAPGMDHAAIIFNPETAPYCAQYLRSFEAAPRSIAVELVAAPVHNDADIEAAVAAVARNPGGGLIAFTDPFINTHRGLIITLADRHRLPAVHALRQAAEEGALMSYSPDTLDIVQRSASYVDRILKGEKPGDLPAQAPVKFVSINLRTAKKLGLEVPLHLQQLADEVIE